MGRVRLEEQSLGRDHPKSPPLRGREGADEASDSKITIQEFMHPGPHRSFIAREAVQVDPLVARAIPPKKAMAQMVNYGTENCLLCRRHINIHINHILSSCDTLCIVN